MKKKRRRKCPHCRELFRPDPRNRHHQRYCSQAPCQRASKAADRSEIDDIQAIQPPGLGADEATYFAIALPLKLFDDARQVYTSVSWDRPIGHRCRIVSRGRLRRKSWSGSNSYAGTTSGRLAQL